jgi:hypothetical protein
MQPAKKIVLWTLAGGFVWWKALDLVANLREVLQTQETLYEALHKMASEHSDDLYIGAIAVVCLIWATSDYWLPALGLRSQELQSPRIILEPFGSLTITSDTNPRTGEAIGQSAWILISSRSSILARECTPFLLSVDEEAKDGRWVPTRYNREMPVEWCTPGPLAQDLQPGRQHDFQVLSSHSYENRLRLRTVPQLNEFAELLERNKSYRLMLQVSGSNAKSEPFGLRLTWSGDWNAIAFESLGAGEQDSWWADLRRLKNIGVEIRNSRVSDGTCLPAWIALYRGWRSNIIEAAGHLSRNLQNRLQVLNEMYGIPSNVVPLNEEHALYVGIMSEILRRVDAYIEKNE